MDSRKLECRWKKDELIGRIEVSRLEVAEQLNRAAGALNVIDALRRSFRENTWKWLAGALASGLLMTQARMLRARFGPEPGNKAGGMRSAALQGLFALAQPYLLAWAQRAVESLLDLASANRAAGSSFSRPEPMRIENAGMR